jgi:hypothetical protein
MSGPMDPFDDLRAIVPTTPPGCGLAHVDPARVHELLADRDHWAAEAERLRGEREAARGKAETFALALAVEAGRPVAPYLAALDWTTPEEEQPDAQASLDAAAHAQLEGQYAAAYGGETLSEVAALEGIEEPT